MATGVDSETFHGTWLESYYEVWKKSHEAHAHDGDHDEDGEKKMSNTIIYLVSLYWTVTTVSTVGYGDISGTNMIEKIFCIFAMIVGVVFFSFATGSLSSIISNVDSSSALMQERQQTLNRVYKDFKLPLQLYIRIQKAMNYEVGKDIQEL